jgi:hypothetical protein
VFCVYGDGVFGDTLVPLYWYYLWLTILNIALLCGLCGFVVINEDITTQAGMPVPQELHKFVFMQFITNYSANFP